MTWTHTRPAEQHATGCDGRHGQLTACPLDLAQWHDDALADSAARGGPTGLELLATLRAMGVRTDFEDLAGCPGSQYTPYLCVETDEGTLIACGLPSGEWAYPDERLGESLHLQEQLADGEPGRIWLGVNPREAVSILATYGARSRPGGWHR